MNKPTETEVPKNLILAVAISIGITLTVSVSYTVLSILGLVYRNQCDQDEGAIDGAGYFINVLFRVYIQSDECENSVIWEDLTQGQTVFVLNILTLCASLVTCAAAIALLIVVLREEHTYLHLAVYVYIAVCCGSLVVDLTFATHFGMDYTHLTDQLSISSPGLAMNYERDVLRLGALLLMTICLKGYVATFINCVLFGLIIFFLNKHKGMQKKEEHSIHKLGALNAYDQPRRQDPWQPETQMFYRGPQVNPAFRDDQTPPPRSPRREPSMQTDFSRSDIWKNQGGGAARPFSYLEEPKRGGASPAEPWGRNGGASAEPWGRNGGASAEPWGRNGGAPAEPWGRNSGAPAEPWGRNAPPPVPAPDYSPHTPRRLKPALKPYM